MNWQPLISRWRVEADRRQQQLEAARGTSAYNATEQGAIIRTLRACADQAEKSLKRQQRRRENRVVVRVTKAPDEDGPRR